MSGLRPQQPPPSQEAPGARPLPHLISILLGSEVCILGLGVTGLAVARYFLRLPSPPNLSIYVEDLTPKNERAIIGLADEFFSDQSTMLTNEMRRHETLLLVAGSGEDLHYLHIHTAAKEVREDYRLGVISPGIKPTAKLFQSAHAHCDELIGEPELAFRVSPQRWLAVTGTNGKTTTTWLLSHLLNVAGIPARVAGNIGPTLIDAVQERADDEYIVAELSSFQLANSPSIAPEAAILLNITTDHISWHGSFDAYYEAKLRVFSCMRPNDIVVIDAVSRTGQGVIARAEAAGHRVVRLGRPPAGGDAVEAGLEAAWVDSAGRLALALDGRTESVIAASKLRIKGEHNQMNALAGAAVALHVGASVAALERGLATFAPIEHRIEPAGRVGGVEFFNDSKATNPEATLMALSAFDDRPLILLLGGEDKHTPLDELVDRTLQRCRLVLCYGQAAQRFFDAFTVELRKQEREEGVATSHCQVLLSNTMREAFQVAASQARPGDVVLLSPASASFDEFSCFEERGATFKQYVAEMVGWHAPQAEL
ncbi:MAG: UDP-N-acetylmuramoyl-L-alanine--D-glutamate ligase [Actinomycetia bacterium]|nr:UDP-N-acetylmuramoyl-L-alanine--D-glutamate ligase [Actinomycetes bacterium]